MKTITYHDYYDRVYGCFLGKCIGGTAGGPAEGRKELLDYPLDEAILHTALPNDDLDLQILWLEVIEEKGLFFTARDLAQSFYDNVPYGPGEYAYFKKNFGRGIMPPVSGSSGTPNSCFRAGCIGKTSQSKSRIYGINIYNLYLIECRGIYRMTESLFSCRTSRFSGVESPVPMVRTSL